MEYRILGKTGLRVSALGFGASSLGSVFRQVDEAAAIRTTRIALEAGINIIDVSPAYGETRAETVLGQALSGVPRESYILATKAGKNSDTAFDFRRAQLVRSAEDSMRRMGVDYLDILQLHDVEYQGGRFLEQALTEGAEALQLLKRQGKIRFWGVTGYPLDVLAAAIERLSPDVVIAHNHYCLHDTQLLDYLPVIRRNGVGLIAAAPLGMGLLTHHGPAPWHPATEAEKRLFAEAAALCDRSGTPIEQLAVQFAVHHPEIPTTLVSTAEPAEILANIAHVGRPPDLDLVERVRQVLTPLLNKDWDFGGYRRR